MGRCILKLIDKTTNKDYYMEWSTIVDAPVTYGMGLAKFKEYYLSEYGRSGMDNLDGRLKRVEETGSSSYLDKGWENVIANNRAGPNGTELSFEDILERYCRTNVG